MIFHPVTLPYPTDHPQVLVPISMRPCHVDADIADFVYEVSKAIAFKAKTDFSCQGDPGKRFVSAYLLLSSNDEAWIGGLAARLTSILRTVCFERGMFPHKKPTNLERKRPFLEKDAISRDAIRRTFGDEAVNYACPYEGVAYRLNIRWRPEDFVRVCLAFRIVLAEI
jgi:hypothetical protein